MPSDNKPQDNRPKHADQTLFRRPQHENFADQTLIRRPTSSTVESQPVVNDSPLPSATPAPPPSPPWIIQQHSDGEIDLGAELVKRFPSIPLMSTIRFRSLGSKSGRGVAILSTVDGSASVTIDADATTQVVQMSFSYNSMLALRFVLDDLTDADRAQWLEKMRSREGELTFLWGPTRWQKDYIICVSHRYYTNFFAFSSNNFEAAARMTPDVVEKLLAWLEEYWRKAPLPDEPPELLTW